MNITELEALVTSDKEQSVVVLRQHFQSVAESDPCRTSAHAVWRNLERWLADEIRAKAPKRVVFDTWRMGFLGASVVLFALGNVQAFVWLGATWAAWGYLLATFVLVVAMVVPSIFPSFARTVRASLGTFATLLFGAGVSGFFSALYSGVAAPTSGELAIIFSFLVAIVVCALAGAWGSESAWNAQQKALRTLRRNHELLILAEPRQEARRFSIWGKK